MFCLLFFVPILLLQRKRVTKKQYNEYNNTMEGKESIKIRTKKISNENLSIYLDIYRNGKREYEFLKLYLVPEKNKLDKEKNKQTMLFAESVKAKRIIDMQNKEYGFPSAYKLDTNFLEYYRGLCERNKIKSTSKGSAYNWTACLKHLEGFCKHDTTFRDVDSLFVDGFQDYLNQIKSKLGRPLSQNSKVRYFEKLRYCINRALEDRIISNNPLKGIKGFKIEETHRVYLTLEEVRKMAATECKYIGLYNAFLFSCLTGIRKSDIEKITWSQVYEEGAYKRIIFKQKKTGGQEYLDISKNAEVYMGKRKNGSELVFTDFRYSSSLITELRIWALKAGIKKDVTYHSSRHTFAVLMLDLGTDLYTVSKLLGHREIKTTQIYAKVVDKKKQEAIDLIPDILGI